jgi:hypothetical protein
MSNNSTTQPPSPGPRNQAELVERIQRSWAVLEQTFGRLSEAQMIAIGPDGWSIKDHLAHVATWEESLTAILQSRPRHLALGVDERTYLEAGEDELNASIYEYNKQRPLAEVLGQFQGAHRRMLVTLQALTDADLLKTYSDFLPEEPGEDSGTPMLMRTPGSTYEHYDDHRVWITALIAPADRSEP